MKETKLTYSGNEFWCPEKPTAKIVGENGNIFNVLGIARKALIGNGQKKEADEMKNKAFNAGGYDEALQIITEYVKVV